MSEPQPSGKPFVISKWVVWEAYQKVKANDGAAGVDGESIEEFERDRKGNLCKLWNRLSSGSYFPAPVRAVEIPEKHGQGKVRVLGVPTWRTVSPRRSCACISSRRWNRCFTPTQTAIDQDDRRCRRWGSAESGAGRGTA
jgi:hypothetical protein